MMFVSGENIHVHTVFFCFFSFVGLYFVKGLSILSIWWQEEMGTTGCDVSFFLFWTSGGLKEAIIILGLGLLLYGFLFFKEKSS
jgi:hypothetical protein